jgi:hypothetical protein
MRLRAEFVAFRLWLQGGALGACYSRITTRKRLLAAGVAVAVLFLAVAGLLELRQDRRQSPLMAGFVDKTLGLDKAASAGDKEQKASSAAVQDKEQKASSAGVQDNEQKASAAIQDKAVSDPDKQKASATDEPDEAAAVKAIEKFGGSVTVDTKQAGKPVIAVQLFWSKVTDAGLKELAGLKRLQSLDLSGTNVTDAGLKELAVLKSLQSLDLGRTQVTDAGLKLLIVLNRLQLLNLSYTQVTDAGLKELAGLQSLKSLNLYRTKVTDCQRTGNNTR